MAVDKLSGEVITLQEAEKYTKTFQSLNPDQIKSFFVGINKVNLVLEQQDCIGLRIYNGFSEEEGVNNLVIVGVDSDGEDLANGVILERLVPCPRFCPKNSPLISK